MTPLPQHATRIATVGPGGPIWAFGHPHRIEQLDDAVLHRLQAARSYPSVSVLVTTTPGPALASKDVVRLDRLIGLAIRRLAADLTDDRADTIAGRLRRLAVDARRNPAGRALALDASRDDMALVQIPVPVADRVVVDPTFATRDLVRALALRPRYRILTVSDHNSRILEGWPGQLQDVGGGLPQPTGAAHERHDRGRRFGREQSAKRQARSAAQFRHVAEEIAACHVASPLPLIVAGVARHQSRLRGAPGLGDAVIGTIPGNHDRSSVAQSHRLAGPIIDGHVRAARRAALDRLAAVDPDRCVAGIDDVWAAAVEGRVTLLCVEESFAFAARATSSGRRLQPARDVEHPDVLDDAVDDMIEMTCLAGGEVVVVHDGALERSGHIAAVLRTC